MASYGARRRRAPDPERVYTAVTAMQNQQTTAESGKSNQGSINHTLTATYGIPPRGPRLRGVREMREARGAARYQVYHRGPSPCTGAPPGGGGGGRRTRRRIRVPHAAFSFFIRLLPRRISRRPGCVTINRTRLKGLSRVMLTQVLTDNTVSACTVVS